MAIMGPADLPYILKTNSTPIKKYVLSKLGYPAVDVEIAEDQWETVMKTAGDFIAHYFSKEQMFWVFWTQPLESTYDLPPDAYWVQEVSWDPVTTNIDQIFGAESFLFCFADGMQILREDSQLIRLEDWKPEFMAKTPYGKCRIILERHDQPQELVEVSYGNGSIRCTPNHPLKINDLQDMLGDWEIASSCKSGVKLVGVDTNPHVDTITYLDKASTTTVYAVGSHCFYGCHNGQPILVH